MSFVGSNILAGASGQGDAGYKIERSLRFNSADSAYLNRTPSSAGNRRTFTWSGWVKRAGLTAWSHIYTQGPNPGSWDTIRFDNTNDKIYVSFNSNATVLQTDASFRDVSAWYHIVVAVDTTQTTSADRVKIYVNGVEQSVTGSYPTQNQELSINNTTEARIGLPTWNTTENLNGYLADVHFIDGQALAPTDFGEYDDNNVWQPKKFTGSYTTAASGTTTSISQVGWASSDEANIWDGNTSTRAVGYVNNTVGTITFSPALTNVTKVETYTQPYNHFLNGSSVSPSGSGNPGWYTLYDNSSSPITLNSLGNSYGSTQTVDLYAIRINGTVVNAQTWTPPSGVGLKDDGENSFYLKFADNSSDSALGTDSSGNSNTFTVNNINAASQTSSTGSSWYFNGTSANCSVDDSSIALGSGDYTVEYFLKPDTGYNAQSTHYNGMNGNSPNFETDGATKFRLMGGSTYGPTLSAGSWYHCAVVRENGACTMWVNGTRVAHNIAHTTNYTNTKHIMGARSDNNVDSTYTKGWLSNIHVIVGTAKYSPSSSTINIPLVPIATHPNTKLLALHASTMVDGSGQNLTITNNGATVSNDLPSGGAAGSLLYSDSLIDTPTDYEAAVGNAGGNYATLNPLNANLNSTTISQGNLTWVKTSSSVFAIAYGTIGVNSGKYYYEATVNSYSGNFNIGWNNAAGGPFADADTNAAFYSLDGGVIRQRVNTTSSTIVASGKATSTGIIGMAIDCDNNTVSFYHNNSLQHTVTGMAADTYFPRIYVDGGGNASNVDFNFGQRPFAYTPPAGYKSLCTTNLPDPTIADGSTAMNVALYNGNNGTNAITGLGFSPDMLWLKSRSSGSFPALANTVVGPNYFLRTNSTNAESGPGYSDDIVSFDSDGFTLGADTYYAFCNRSPNTYVAWAWDAGSSNTSISAGGLNSSFYNQSQTWSNLVTGTLDTQYGNSSATAPFDGDTGSVYSDGIRPTSGNYLSMNFGTTFANATSVKIYGHASLDGVTYSGAEENLKINGTAIGSSAWADNGGGAGTSSATFTLSSGLTSLEWGYSSGSQSTGYLYLQGIEVDGKLLVDQGVTPPNVPTLASTVRANPSTGFSIATFSKSSGTSTTNTVGHSLNAEPHFIVTKQRDGTEPWYCYHKALGASARIQLNESSAQTTGSSVWGSTAPTSSVFSIRNVLNGDYLALLFAPVEGYSAFGSYTGNGSTDGVFVYTGFKPAFLLIKRTDASSSWYIFDSTRSTFNVVDDRLQAHSGNAENTNSAWNNDFLSNGFKLRTAEIELNNNGSLYIYACFSEHPFKTARAR